MTPENSHRGLFRNLFSNALVQYRQKQPSFQPTAPSRVQPMMIGLEDRKMLSAVLTDGVLTVTGTSKKDAIVVSISSDGETISVSERTAKRFKRTTATKTNFAADDVTSIVVNTGAGNDNVSLRSNRATDLTVSSTIDGGDGDDRLSGGEGADSITGGLGDDDLYGNGGTDLLNGGDGDDLVNGGDGIDTLNGDAGDDLMQSAGDGEIDIVDGGADSAVSGEDDEDQSIADDDETPVNVAVVDDIDVIPSYGGGFGGHFGGFGFGPIGHGGGHGGGHGPRGGDSSTDTGTSTGTATSALRF